MWIHRHGFHHGRVTLWAMLGWLSAGLPWVSASSPSEAGEGLHLSPAPLWVVGGVPITNSMLAAWLSGAVLVVLAWLAMRHATLVPGRLQGLLEMIGEALLDFLAGIMGEHLARKTFWLLGTLFLFVLVSNWMGLLPGFGTIGWGAASEHGLQVTRPLLRGADADVNLTFGIAALLSGFWLIWSVQEQGVRGFLWHLFGPKGSMKGFMGMVLGIIFFAAGLLDLISIAFRPVSLSLRLFGNIFAGETMMEAMLHALPRLGWLLPVPFYFVELLVGLVQACVFTLLAAIFVMLSCHHDEEPSASPGSGGGRHAAS
ncbi:MAG: F0F1 ATP synthase subunit A [Lentisphaerae bacterium]|nr:F0F1 ATP synthase subunit A [Lentisphaerota bacterium]